MKLTKPLFLLCSLLVFASCGEPSASSKKAEAKKEVEETIENTGILGGIQKAAQALEGIEEDLKSGETAEVVSFRDMKEVLPSKFKGAEMEFKKGENSQMMGFKISTVSADYKYGDGALNVTINDAGGISVAKLALAAWTSVQIDRETADGYERTREIDGHKAYEKYDSRRQRGELAILLDDRFLVTAKGNKIDPDDMEDFLDDINLRKLRRLAK